MLQAVENIDNQENLVDMKTMQKLDEALEKIGRLEDAEKKLLDQTTQLNKTLRSRQSEKFENRLKEFFAVKGINFTVC